ncbi:TIGR01440 family protein [Sporolactobacillus sp. STSJ-5]|uniref:TIGR01440 family protein n=1 Tax=Sporolactobacillus sp. STSJ-5 TaxID=2965076 RepID=UPI002106956D|nr:TIGR01440 family protein [Sporolactobacillus sp. STSJ-5]MCQ2010783.1 TIGR01440 family protein [Sporolactobacillus sp. STSJ-5]
MEVIDESISEAVTQALADLEAAMPFSERTLLVIGCSTSEVAGKHIGTAGSLEVAASLFLAVQKCHNRTGARFAFQCCEHLNRALVIDQEVARQRFYDEVTVRPIRHAGGSMATYAFEHMTNPVMVEFIRADGGLDIGDTLIGMHLKHVAVPVRSQRNEIGHAHLVMARTRPKLIGGERAVYPEKIR